MSAQVEERWLPVVGFPGYEVSNMGRVRSRRMGFRHTKTLLKNPAIMRCYVRKDGYVGVGLSNGVRHRPKMVHRLVLAAFLCEQPPGLEACHNNGKRADNHLSNLRWDTHRNNMADSMEHGTLPRGSRVGLAKLTEAQVRDIRRDARFH